jgi:DNA-binding transcriptional ArsR family regulator
MTVPAAHKDELEGITLSVYLYAVKKGSPLGPRDAVKGAHLSSPSVAYRHLERLEEMGLLAKNEYGEYTVKRKAKVPGHVWLGRRLLPSMLAISFIFLGSLTFEAIVLTLHYFVETFEFKVFFALLMIVTGAAMSVFIAEGLLQRRRLIRTLRAEQTENLT